MTRPIREAVPVDFGILRSKANDVRVVSDVIEPLVGAALGISEITVKAHRGRVMHKMNAASLAELVTMAMRLNLPPVPTIPLPIAASRARYTLRA